MHTLDSTHDPARRSWVDSAHGDTDFPIQNLPFGAYVTSTQQPAGLAVAIGDQALLLAPGAEAGLFDGLPPDLVAALRQPVLNALMARPRSERVMLRHRLADLLDEHNRDRRRVTPHLVPANSLSFGVPASVGDYTDFYASVFHATNVGSMFRPDNPLLPNYKFVPIGYHGRASSLVASGTTVRRPSGQTKGDTAAVPVFGPSVRLDYELELGLFVGPGNNLGQPIPIGQAEEHLFGVCLVNDWSARDLQQWEYQPLGPFLAKNFATTLSPWVVTMEALMPFRAPAFKRPDGDPAPLPYLWDESDQQAGGLDLSLEVLLSSAKMRESQQPPMRVSRGNFQSMYWTLAQLLAHHASNGCRMRPGDLLASGTVSGSAEDSRGCLLERTWRGTQPLTLPTGETRRFLEDGDEVILRGECSRPGLRRIGLGECRGLVAGAS